MFGIDNAISEGLKVINKFIPDKDLQAKMEAEYRTALLNIDAQQALAQSETNKIEAASSRLFIAGWRPFIGWICGCAMAYHFILQPLIAFLFAAFNHPITLPSFDMNTLYTVLMGLLGLGGMRSLEKIKGATK